MQKRLNIALLIETSNSYARGLLRGITSYMREHGPWSVYLAEHGRGDDAPPWLRNWQGDGIIARIENQSIANALKDINIPLVDVSAARLIPELPWIETDDIAIADLAANHLLERGFKHFAFCGDHRYNWSNWRRDHFAKRIEQAKHTCHFFQSSQLHETDAQWSQTQQKLDTWLKKLPKPIGIMACYDIRGQQLLDACRRLNIAVPEQVAVIGVDNDEVLCELSNPPMSSVIPDTQRTGYEAAAILHQLIDGQKVSSDGVLIKPFGIASRLSTEISAINDPIIAKALQVIRENATLGLNVEQLVTKFPISRRVFESRFRKFLGRTPHEEIARIRIDRAKQLLRETDLPLATIAENAGFKHVEYLSTQFKKSVGLPPSIYRKQHAK